MSNWENQVNLPDIENLRRLVRAGLDPSYLLGDAVPVKGDAGEAA